MSNKLSQEDFEQVILKIKSTSLWDDGFASKLFALVEMPKSRIARRKWLKTYKERIYALLYTSGKIWSKHVDESENEAFASGLAEGLEIMMRTQKILEDIESATPAEKEKLKKVLKKKAPRKK